MADELCPTEADRIDRSPSDFGARACDVCLGELRVSEAHVLVTQPIATELRTGMCAARTCLNQGLKQKNMSLGVIVCARVRAYVCAVRAAGW